MSNQRDKIIALYELGKLNCEIARLLAIHRQTVSKTVKRFQELGHAGRRQGSGRKRSACISRNRELI